MINSQKTNFQNSVFQSALKIALIGLFVLILLAQWTFYLNRFPPQDNQPFAVTKSAIKSEEDKTSDDVDDMQNAYKKNRNEDPSENVPEINLDKIKFDDEIAEALTHIRSFVTNDPATFLTISGPLIKTSGRPNGWSSRSQLLTEMESMISIKYSRPSDESFKTKIAYSIMVYDRDSLYGVVEFLDIIFEERHFFIIHLDEKKIDYSDVLAFTQAYENFPNIKVFSEFSSDPGDYVVLEIQLKMIQLALEIGSWDTIINICGNTFPISSPKKIAERVTKYRNCNSIFINDQVIPLCPGFQCYRRRMKSTFDLYLGSPWFMMTHAFAKYLMHNSKPRHLAMFMKQGVLEPDDVYFSSAFMSANQKYDHCNIYSPGVKITLSSQDKALCPGDTNEILSTCSFDIQSFQSLSEVDYLFVRKIKPGSPLRIAILSYVLQLG